MMASGANLPIPSLAGMAADDQLFASSSSDSRVKRVQPSTVEEDEIEAKRLRALDGEQMGETLAAIRDELVYIRQSVDALKAQLGGLTTDMGDIKKQSDRQKWLELKDVKARLQQGLKERLVDKSFFVDDLKQDVKNRTRQVLFELGKKKEFCDSFVEDSVSMAPIQKYASEFWQSLRSQIRRKCVANEEEYQHWGRYDSKTFAEKFAASLGSSNPPELKCKLAFLREIAHEGNFWHTAHMKWPMYDREERKERFCTMVDARIQAAMQAHQPQLG